MNDDVFLGVPFAWGQPPDSKEARAFVQARLVSGESFGKPGRGKVSGDSWYSWSPDSDTGRLC